VQRSIAPPQPKDFPALLFHYTGCGFRTVLLLARAREIAALAGASLATLRRNVLPLLPRIACRILWVHRLPRSVRKEPRADGENCKYCSGYDHNRPVWKRHLVGTTAASSTFTLGISFASRTFANSYCCVSSSRRFPRFSLAEQIGVVTPNSGNWRIEGKEMGRSSTKGLLQHQSRHPSFRVVCVARRPGRVWHELVHFDLYKSLPIRAVLILRLLDPLQSGRGFDHRLALCRYVDCGVLAGKLTELLRRVSEILLYRSSRSSRKIRSRRAEDVLTWATRRSSSVTYACASAAARRDRDHPP